MLKFKKTFRGVDVISVSDDDDKNGLTLGYIDNMYWPLDYEPLTVKEMAKIVSFILNQKQE